MTSADDRLRRSRIVGWVVPLGALGVLALVVAFGIRARSKPNHAGPLGRAVVSVYDDGRPLADRWVVFQDSEGKVTSSTRSGADGKASGEVHAGSMVTVAFGTSVQHLVTILAVKPGDEIVIGEREDEGGSGNTVAPAKVLLPGPLASAARYAVSLGVGTTEVADVTRPLPMPILRRFLVDEGKFRVLGLALDASGEALAFAFDWGTLGATDGGDAEVRLPAWSTDWREQRIILSNPPAGLTKAAAELAIVVGEHAQFERGRREATVQGETSLRFSVPRPLGTDTLYRLELTYGTSGDKALHSRRAKSLPDDVRLDLRVALLPRISAAVVETTRDRSRPVAHWTVAGDVGSADATIVQLAWPDTREHVWTIVGPATQRPDLEVPELPEALRAWRPDGRPIRGAVGLFDVSGYAGYDDVRQKGIQPFNEPPEDDETVLRTSTTGALVF
jgi:hypothetical protein